MRRSRRNGHGGLEFGGSGEDSFVAVVVTKLTGALLFILLLTMVIMALLAQGGRPAGRRTRRRARRDRRPLAIATPETLPEAIAGRPYTVALAAPGRTRAACSWAVDGKLPEGLTFDPESAQIRGTPEGGRPSPRRWCSGSATASSRASQGAQLVVYQSDQPLTMPSKWKPGLPPIPWRAWLDQGFGFLVLWLVHLVGMSTLGNLQRWSLGRIAADSTVARGRRKVSRRPRSLAERAVRRRFALLQAVSTAGHTQRGDRPGRLAGLAASVSRFLPGRVLARAAIRPRKSGQSLANCRYNS